MRSIRETSASASWDGSVHLQDPVEAGHLDHTANQRFGPPDVRGAELVRDPQQQRQPRAVHEFEIRELEIDAGGRAGEKVLDAGPEGIDAMDVELA